MEVHEFRDKSVWQRKEANFGSQETKGVGSWDSIALDQNDLGKCFSSAIRPKMYRMC